MLIERSAVNITSNSKKIIFENYARTALGGTKNIINYKRNALAAGYGIGHMVQSCETCHQ